MAMKNNLQSCMFFQDQCQIFGEWFNGWNDCERTVALITIFAKVKRTQISLLSTILEQFKDKFQPEIRKMENMANSTSFASGLQNQKKAFVVSQLLENFPMLRRNNDTCKAEYVHLLHKILAHTLETNQDLEASRQLLSYAVIHPALSTSERNTFRDKYLKELDNRQDLQVPMLPLVAIPNFQVLSAMSSAAAHGGLVGGARAVGNAVNPGSRIYVDPSSIAAALTMPVVGVNNVGGRAILAAGNKAGGGQMPGNVPLTTPLTLDVTQPSYPANFGAMPVAGMNSGSSSSAWSADTLPYSANSTASSNFAAENFNRAVGEDLRPLVSPASVSSTNSDAQIDEFSYAMALTTTGSKNTYLEARSGMRDVPVWLKTLRLHKYSPLFQLLSYEEMMNLNDEYLARMKVTKGARHRILESISKLKDRPKMLRGVERELERSNNINACLNEVKNMLDTPIKPGDEEEASENVPPNSAFEAPHCLPLNSDSIPDSDLPSLMTFLMGKMCSQLLVAGRPDDNTLCRYIQVLDRMLGHEAWSATNQKKLYTWKTQSQRLLRPILQKFQQKNAQKPQYSYPAHNMRGVSACPAPYIPTKPQVAHFPSNGPGDPSKWNYMNETGFPVSTTGIYQQGGFTNIYGGLNQMTRHPLVEAQSLNSNMTASQASALFPPINASQLTPASGSQSSAMFPPANASQPSAMFTPARSSAAEATFVNTPVSDTSTLDHSMEPEMAANLRNLCLSMTEHALSSDTPEKVPLSAAEEQP